MLPAVPLPTAPWHRAHRSYQAEVHNRLLVWRERYAILVLCATRTESRYRHYLGRDLTQLSGCRDRLSHLVEELAVARTRVQWEATRSRIEAAWDELDALTDKLLRLVRARRANRQ